VDTSKIREWILDNTEKMVEYNFLQMDQIKELNQVAEIDARINEE